MLIEHGSYSHQVFQQTLFLIINDSLRHRVVLNDILDLLLKLFLRLTFILIFLGVRILIRRDNSWASGFYYLFGVLLIFSFFEVIEVFVVSDKENFLEVKRWHHPLFGLSFHHLRDSIDRSRSIGDAFVHLWTILINFHDLAHHIDFTRILDSLSGRNA